MIKRIVRAYRRALLGRGPAAPAHRHITERRKLERQRRDVRFWHRGYRKAIG